MSNELEHQIKEELFKEKINRFYLKYKKTIIISLFLAVIIPIIFQVVLYFNNKKQAQLLSEYLRAEIIIQKDPKEAINILISLKDQSNETISLLSFGRLLEYYLSNGEKLNAKKLVQSYDRNFKSEILNEIKILKTVILNFEDISENQILKLLKDNKSKNNFINIKKRLVIDFYKKNNQIEKLKQIEFKN